MSLITIDLLSDAQVVLAIIPLVLGVEINEELDQITDCTFEVSAEWLPEVEAADKFRIFREGEGQIFIGHIGNIEANLEGSTITVHGYSFAIELEWENSFYGMNLGGPTVTVASALNMIGNHPTPTWGWHSDYSNDPLYIRVDGTTLWSALREVAAIHGAWLRETDYVNGVREVDTKKAFTTVPFRLWNTDQPVVNPPNDIGIIESLSGYSEDRESIVTTVLPFGASSGDRIYDLAKSNRSSPYTIQQRKIDVPAYTPGGTSGYWPTFSVAPHTSEGRNRLFLCVIVFDDATDSVISVSINNEPATLHTRNTASNWAFEVWFLCNPQLGSGARAIVSTSPASSAHALLTIIYRDVEVVNDAPIRNVAVATGTGTALSGSVGSEPKDRIISIARVASGTLSGFTADSDTGLLAFVGQNQTQWGHSSAIDTSTAWAFTNSASVAWKTMGIALKCAPNYYIEDAAAVSQWHRRVFPMQMKELHWPPGGDLDVQIANSLYDRAANYLLQARNPIIKYGEAVVSNLPLTGWRVGDKIPLEYTGEVTLSTGRKVWKSIDTEAVILGRRQIYDSNGTRKWHIKLANGIRKLAAFESALKLGDAVSRLPAL